MGSRMLLSIVQKNFQNYLRTYHPKIVDAITENNTLSAKDRLTIYFDAYRLRLLEILENDYPKLQVLIGAEGFDKLGREYIEALPSRHFSVRYFGKTFASFLMQASHYSDYPYLHEMTTFEWAMGNALDAEDAPILAPEALQSLPLDRFAELTIRFHPSLKRLHFLWNTTQLWQAIENAEKPCSPEKLANPATYIVYRSDLTCVFRSLDENEAIALQALQDLSNMAEACEKLNEHMEEEKVPVFILQCISQWLADGIISEMCLLHHG